jgi:3'(2'), 5'-bisphosphate nucleotidase
MNYKDIDITQVLDLAYEAGKAILDIYEREDFGVQEKSDNTPLTMADLKAHQVICDGLTRLTPDVPILSEESTNIPYEERQSWKSYWLVDPLDGTREFIDRNGQFTVNIAYITDQQAMIGVVYVPVKDLVYYAKAGEPAYKMDTGGKAEKINVRSSVQGHPVAVAGSRSHAGESLIEFLNNLGEYELFSMGSALKSCLVAEGAVDIYPRFGPTSEWDTGASQCIVEAAGGFVTDIQMRTLKYNTKDSLLNPYFLVFGDDSHHWAYCIPETVKQQQL